MSLLSDVKLSRRAMILGAAALPFGPKLASAATDWRDRLMVQGRPQDTGSPYKYRNIMPALDALGGIRKMRCRAPFDNTPGWLTYASLAKAGVTFCFTLPIKEPALLVADMVTFVRHHPNSIWAIEFPNEPDLNPVAYAGMRDKRLGARTGEAPALMAFCRDVTRLLTETPELSGIPRIAFNNLMVREQRDLVTYANSHNYPKPNTPPDAWMQSWNKMLATGGYKQGVITEWGRTTGGNEENVVSPPVTLAQQADLLGADINSILSQPSVAVLSLYELLSWGNDTEQGNFGLFNADMTPRPIVNVIRSMIG